ncbi:MAG: hypothetical protein EXR27_21360 [Betaproteobacteria bacterium]|nr:hypothetical protein [Betaproteobacteria bacterium]
MSQASTPPDPFEFLKMLWGPFGLPIGGAAASAPAFKGEDIDKRIGELKLVENWLNMNLQVLRMSIQGLEMQKATLSAMQGAYAAADKSAAAHSTEGYVVPPPSPLAQGPLAEAWWNLLQAQMGKPGNTPGTPQSEKK